jgi:hypothetical protein
VSKTGWLFETARKLGEARHILEGVEATALRGVAQVLAETVESLALKCCSASSAADSRASWTFQRMSCG